MHVFLVLMLALGLASPCLAETVVTINGKTISVTGSTIIIDGGLLAESQAVKGSGTLIEETREIPIFTSISLRIPAEVTVSVVKPPETTEPAAVKPKLSLHGDDNILKLVTTTVEEGRLAIASERSFRRASTIQIRIEMPAIVGAEILGSGFMRISGVDSASLSCVVRGSGDLLASGRAQKLAATVSGSGDLKLADLAVEEASVAIDGSGSAEVAAQQRLVARLNGSGDLRSRLATTHCELLLNGSGDAEVAVRERLVAELNGSGDLIYFGAPPEVKVTVNGSGDVKAKPAKP